MHKRVSIFRCLRFIDFKQFSFGRHINQKDLKPFSSTSPICQSFLVQQLPRYAIYKENINYAFS